MRIENVLLSNLLLSSRPSCVPAEGAVSTRDEPRNPAAGMAPAGRDPPGSSWPHTGPPQNQTVCLRALPKRSVAIFGCSQ